MFSFVGAQVQWAEEGTPLNLSGIVDERDVVDDQVATDDANCIAKGVIGQIGLQTSALTASAQRAIKLHFRMAKFQPHAMGAAKQLVVADKAHANAIFNRHNDEVAQSASRAKP